MGIKRFRTEQNLFDDRFETFVADTELAKAIHYNLRYRVYCLDKGFENSAAFPDQQETDIYDINAVHFIVRHRESGQWVGAMRLVIGVPTQLPLFQLTEIDTHVFKYLTGALVAEASRLCISLPTEIFSASQKNKSTELYDTLHPSSVSLGLIRAARAYCLNHDIRFSYFLITSQLARLLQRVGMEIRVAGPAVQHRGLRYPYVHDFIDGYKSMREKMPLVYKLFQTSPAYKFHSKVRVRRAPHKIQLCI
jgi:N-acyl amino acid synthase of PEP-CTERM/exosortase system